MSLKEHYTVQARDWETGANVDGRVRKAGSLFRRYLLRASRLLDIGCGVGEAGRYLGAVLQCHDISGVDIAEARVAGARARGIDARVCDLNEERLPFPDGTFDAVFCGETIEHVVDPDRLLDEIGRMLAPEGVCVLTTPNLASWHNRVALALGWQPFCTSVSFRHDVGRPRFLSGRGDREHLRVFTVKALRELLALHGFVLLETAGVGFYDTTRFSGGDGRPREILLKALTPLDMLLARRPSLAFTQVVAFVPGVQAEPGHELSHAV